MRQPFLLNFGQITSMNSNKDASLYYPVSNAYDACIVSSFLKRLFTLCREKKVSHELVIKNNVLEVKRDLELLNGVSGLELSFDYLSAMESSLPDAAFRYVVIYKDSKPALFAYFQLFLLSKQNFNLEKNAGFAKGILRFFLKLKKAKVLMLGNAVRTGTLSYCFDADVIGKEEAVAAIAGIAEKIASDENATAVILKDISAVSPTGQQVLKDMGYQTPWNDQVMEMEVNSGWKTLDDYIALLTRKYKTRANKILAARKHLEVKVLSQTEVVHYQPDIKRLFSALIDRQSFTLTTGGVNNIADFKNIYGDDFDVIGFLLEGQLVAFYTAFHNESNYEIYYAGFDYELNNEHQLYFNILFSGLERAITLQKSLLKLGRTSFDAKASIGAKPKATDYLIKLSHIPDIVIKWFACYFSSLEDSQWKLRNPLKQPAV